MTQYEQTLKETFKEFPDFRIRRKSESLLMKVISFLLFFNKGFMTTFVTTIRYTVYVPDRWDTWPEPEKIGIIRHERVHMRQCRKYGFLLFSFLYLFWPLPMFYAKARADFEKEAYEESLRTYYEYRGRDFDQQERALFLSILDHFTTGQYAWMWPFPADIAEWYQQTVSKIRASSRQRG